jgi:hypothetical protein
MRNITRIGLTCLTVVALAACAKQEMPVAAESDAATGAREIPQAYLGKPGAPPSRAPAGTSLAYETDISIRMPGKDISARVAAVQSACFSQAVGDCAVLDVKQQGGDNPYASIKVRVAPEGVEKLVGSASQGGEITSRATSAEDLAQAVADNDLRRARLQNEHKRLLEFQDKPNVKLDEMLRLSERMAEVEAQLDVAQQSQAQMKRRIDTNLLTLRFSPTGVEEGGSEIGDAFRDSGSILAGVTAGLIRAAAALLPIAFVAFLMWLIVRRGLRLRKMKLPE